MIMCVRLMFSTYLPRLLVPLSFELFELFELRVEPPLRVALPLSELSDERYEPLLFEGRVLSLPTLPLLFEGRLLLPPTLPLWLCGAVWGATCGRVWGSL